MAQQFKNNFNGGINLDVDFLRLPPNTAAFIKNLTTNVNINANAAALSGGNETVRTPMEGNQALVISGTPAGTNYCIGTYSYETTNEMYFALYNSNGNHSIWVVSGDTGGVTLVYTSPLLPFLLDPKYFLSEGRMTLIEQSVIDPVTQLETTYKFLIITNNNEQQCVIDVGASIATGSYTTPYFTDSSAFYDPLELIHLGSVLPLRPMHNTTIPIGLNNPNSYVPVTSASIIDTATIANPGISYTVGSQGTIAGGTGGTFEVTAIGAGGAVVSFILLDGGTGYAATITPAATSTTSGGGSGLTLNILTLVTPDVSKQNLLINSGWQFRYQTIDVWGRFSNWSIISSLYTVLIGGGCVGTSNGLPRCVNLCFDAGNPLIKYITIAFRRGVGNDVNGQTETDWQTCETFSKYDDSQNVEWYNRAYNPTFITANSGITFNEATNVITYTFCADKQSNPVDPVDAANTEPGLPVTSASVAAIDKSILLANNVYDYQPLPQPVVDSLQFSVSPPSPAQTPCDAAPSRTIVVYAAIYDPLNGARAIIRQSHNKVVFGNTDGSCGNADSAFGIDQVFGDQTAGNSGFIGYLAGTPYTCISTQGYIDPSTGVFTYQGYGSGISFPKGGGAVQQFIFNNVPAGKYIMRVASHKTTISDATLQSTSTYVAGVSQINQLNVASGLSNYAANPVKEIEIDCSTGNYPLTYSAGNPLLVILDLTNSGVDGGHAVDGYLCEQNGSDTPIEMSPVCFQGTSVGAPLDTYGSFFTDHNGFYFASSGALFVSISFFADMCDGAGITERTFYSSANTAYTSVGRGAAGITHGDGSGVGSGCAGVTGNWRNKIFFYPSTGTYPSSARRTITQVLNICGSSSIGAPGVLAIMTKGAYGQTDGSGSVSVIAHNRYNYASSIGSTPLPYLASMLPNYSVSPSNTDYLIFSKNGTCQWNTCSGCGTTISDQLIAYISCCPIPPLTCNRVTMLSPLTVLSNGTGIYGVQSGGKYPVAIWASDIIGRHTDPQSRSGDNGYVSVPNLNDTTPSPYPSMALSSLSLTVPSGLIIPSYFKWINVLVAPNVLFSDFFDWTADWIQYVDNTGATNNTNPTSIRIYFQSLNEYNKQYNQNTNVSWDFISEITAALNGTQPFPVDVVQFIVNGDGSYLPPIKGAPITYSQDGSFFTIAYTSDLAGLTNGCLFRIIRPKQNVTNSNIPYYEQCLTIPVVNGVIQAGNYVIPYQDSYLISRSIPVPLLQGQPNPIAPGAAAPNPIVYTSTNTSTTLAAAGYAENNLANNNNVIVFQTVDAQTNFPFFFESPSPSDLWGSHLSSRGRVGIPNPYEKQYRVGTEVAVSNPLADRGIVNGMGTFDPANAEVFNRNTYGNITVVLVEQGVCMVICNNDYFITRYNQTQLQVDASGNVMGQNPGGSKFTSPQMKMGSNYGVVPENINSIQRYNGQVVFLDNKGHLIFSDFSDAKPVEKDGYMGYLLNKIAETRIPARTALLTG